MSAACFRLVALHEQNNAHFLLSLEWKGIGSIAQVKYILSQFNK